MICYFYRHKNNTKNIISKKNGNKNHTFFQYKKTAHHKTWNALFSYCGRLDYVES